MTNKLVSIITPTYKRHDLLLERCIPSVQNQTYKNIEHYVISDGHDQYLKEIISKNFPKIKYLESGKWWGKYQPKISDPNHQTNGNYAAVHRNVGSVLCNGDYIATLDDDDSYEPTFIEKMVNLIEKEKTDFVYSAIRMPNGIMFSNPPVHGGITTSQLFYKAETFTKGYWNWGYTQDWQIVKSWMDAGCKWSCTHEVLVNYRS